MEKWITAGGDHDRINNQWRRCPASGKAFLKGIRDRPNNLVRVEHPRLHRRHGKRLERKANLLSHDLRWNGMDRGDFSWDFRDHTGDCGQRVRAEGADRFKISL